MERINDGKTKTVFQKSEEELVFLFKDDVTGEAGKIDPGANQVLGELEEKGKSSLALSVYFFDGLKERGISTHFVCADFSTKTMTVKKAVIFGKGLEFICRRFAAGSFVRRYGDYVKKMAELPYVVEITLKDDEQGDPLINDEALLALDIITMEELQKAKDLTEKITKIVEELLKQEGLRLIDIKFEFGKVDGNVVLIDEISGDSMRVMDSDDRILNQIELYKAIFDS